jgi:hypothetical protein
MVARRAGKMEVDETGWRLTGRGKGGGVKG